MKQGRSIQRSGMGKQIKPNEQRIVLENISWEKLEALLSEMGDERTTRFTYDRGRLELMNPLEDHDRCRRLIESLILVLVDELDLLLEGYVAPTLKRPDLGRAIEPDAGYYMQRVAQIQGKGAIDLTTDPAPDLLQEAVLTPSSLNRLSIYAKLGVPEVWQYTTRPGDDFFKGTFAIHVLKQDRYVEASHSLAFPILPASKVLEFIEQSDSIGLMTALRVLRSWVQETIG